MESTRSEELTRVRSSRYSAGGRKNYNRHNGSEDAAYKKSIFTLKILVCIGIFTAALLIRAVDVTFTNELRQKLKGSLSNNIAVDELYNNGAEKIKNIFTTDDATVKVEEVPSESTKKLEESTKKLVPTLEQ